MDIVDQDQLNRLIAEWYRLAIGKRVDSSDPFFRFVAVWVAFNALYSSRADDEVGDWNQVRAYAGIPEVVDRHRTLLQEDSEYSRAVSLLKERGVYDVAGRIHRRISDSRDLTRVASCLYQVRCNLFHGGKAPTNLRDQRLVEASYTIVAKLIETEITT